MQENRVLYIDSNNCVGKITYLDDKNESKETRQFEIRKEYIDKVLELAEKGEKTNPRANTETNQSNNMASQFQQNEFYIVYEIQINSKTTYVDLKNEGNTISSLFIDYEI